MHTSEIERETIHTETDAQRAYAPPHMEVQELRLVTNGGISGFDDSGSISAQQTP